ncbi:MULTISPECIES: DUF2240 family protein [Methanothrix]|uniref:DUF2240 family protein n=1 Tax=Methanothrix thermoacetophila (strain DSM 6194 / JCM 14653 / NBRC 101360 / PT) TaxID=349307 RepID=A0B5F8_METTP|nr:conserved hypothetical protein [Methanothrix thermoacetophila PT]
MFHLDQEKRYLVALPFKKRGKSSLKISDFIFALSLDMKWGPPEKVRALLMEAENEGLVRIDGDVVYSNADIEIPVGFKPAPVEGIFERAVRMISSKTGMSRKEIIAMINERQDSLQRLVELDVVALLVARELEIDVSDMAREAYQSLISSASRKAA